jgi:chitodextrinase
VLTWNASSDSCATVAGYRIYRNGSLIGTSSGTSYTDTGVNGVTTYSYTVLAYDSTSAANASAQSTALSVTTAALPYQITDASGNVIAAASSLYRSAIVPAVCGPGTGNGPCNYVVTQKYGSQLVVRTDTNGVNSFLAPGYSIGSGTNYMATYGTAATYGGYLPPDTPTGLTGGAVSSSQVNLSWTASSDTSGVLAGYRVFRNGSQIGTTAATSYSDTTTTCNTFYSYTVFAYDAASPPDVSGQSSAWSLTTPITIPPTVPAGLTASSVAASQVVLSWYASSDSCSAVAGYRIYRNGAQIGTSSSAGFTDSSVAGGTTYTYTVAAYDSLGTPNVSAQSAGLSVTTPASIYHITDANGNSLSSLYAAKVVPAICGPGTQGGPCNYVVTQTYGSKQTVRTDTNGNNTFLAPGYTTGSGADYKSTYATAAVYGQ